MGHQGLCQHPVLHLLVWADCWVHSPLECPLAKVCVWPASSWAQLQPVPWQLQMWPCHRQVFSALVQTRDTQTMTWYKQKFVAPYVLCRCFHSPTLWVLIGDVCHSFTIKYSQWSQVAPHWAAWCMATAAVLALPCCSSDQSSS